METNLDVLTSKKYISKCIGPPGVQLGFVATPRWGGLPVLPDLGKHACQGIEKIIIVSWELVLVYGS